MKPRLIAIVGPTACGKSDIAAVLAWRIGGEIVSCDSMQVYRGMPIATQAPPKIVRGIRHHLVSFVEPTRAYSAARFRRDAETIVAAVVRRGRVPVLAGGTGLYLRALLDGLFEGPSGDEALRRRLREEAAEKGAAALHGRLAQLDAPSAARIHPNDLRRVVRALEVHQLTGRPLSALRGRRSGLRARYDCRIFLIERDRAELYRRIDRRVDAMMRKGLLGEVKRLRRKRLSRTASMALGIKEMSAYLDAGGAGPAPAPNGRSQGSPLRQAVDLLKKNTRRYAKRQLSWFRHEPGVETVPVGEKDTPAAVAKKIIASLQT